jgi:hypothetical protein
MARAAKSRVGDRLVRSTGTAMYLIQRLTFQGNSKNTGPLCSFGRITAARLDGAIDDQRALGLDF